MGFEVRSPLSQISPLFCRSSLFKWLIIIFMQEPIELSAGVHAPPMFVVTGKVSRAPLNITNNRMFDIDISQYGAESQQIVRVLQKIPVPSAGKHVSVHGHFMDGERCLIRVVDIALGPLVVESTPTAIGADQPPMKIARFDWEKKGKSKRARGDGDQPVASTSTKPEL